MHPQTTKSPDSQLSLSTGDNPASYLKEEYARWQALVNAQSSMIQRFIEAQALNLAHALSQPVSQARFSLPDKVIVNPASLAELPISAEQREQLVGGLVDRLMHTGLNVALRQRLDELEASSSESISIAAGLLRFSTAVAMIHSLLPSGRSIQYQYADGDEIPTIPIAIQKTMDSAITAATDAIVGEETNQQQETGRGELLVPFVEAARRFFLPQWVAFDDQDRLLVSSMSEAEAHLESMQRFTHILHTAVGLAPYMVTDEVYQQKRYGMLGQIINQGRALARFQTREIVETIKRRAAANDLNRGLSLSLPYFDDQTLAMKVHNFDIIPAGRIMFVPAFVVLAVRKELAKVEQDTRLDRSTRKHLLVELRMLTDAFDSSTTPILS